MAADNSAPRDRMLGRMPQPAGDAPPEIALRYPETQREDRTARLVTELQALGARTLATAELSEARAYIEQLREAKGGEAIVAARPTVERLALSAPHFHPYGAFPPSDATLSVTQADYAIAETGSLCLLSEAGEGRTTSLLAPVNVAILPASAIVWNISELLDREPQLAERSSAFIFVTGPSRTADIELTLTVGVHGPGELHVIILLN